MTKPRPDPGLRRKPVGPEHWAEHLWRLHLERRLDVQDEKLDTIIALLRRDIKMDRTQMAKIADVQAKIATLQTSMQANGDSTDALVAYVGGLGTVIAGLKQQIADLIAAGDNSPEVQALADTVDALIAASDADTVKELAIANTPADPNA